MLPIRRRARQSLSPESTVIPSGVRRGAKRTDARSRGTLRFQMVAEQADDFIPGCNPPPMMKSVDKQTSIASAGASEECGKLESSR